ncbi:PCYCGC domain-containing protein [Neobacillus mesonae]|nr:PCYCGC domain-containing protein [Neobacillus mesonae]
MNRKVLWSGIMITTVLLSGCGTKDAAPGGTEEHSTSAMGESHEGHHSHEYSVMANGDIQERTASMKELPSFLDEQPEEMRNIYLLSAQYTDVLQWIPCYCGCGGSAGHNSNLNCFVETIEEDGSVIWDDHGTRCNVCLDVAVASAKMAHDGKAPLEIRRIMDEAYKEGYADPTPTPMPEA